MTANLNELDPSLIPLCRQFITLCQNDGLNVRITVTWRDPEEQDAAHAAGLSNAAAGQSPHNCVDANGNPAARAWDFALIDSNGKYIRNGTDHRYTHAGQIAEQLNLFWGGRWTEENDGCNPDYDHIQMMDWKTAL